MTARSGVYSSIPFSVFQKLAEFDLVLGWGGFLDHEFHYQKNANIV
jgi:hypothetical protein